MHEPSQASADRCNFFEASCGNIRTRRCPVRSICVGEYLSEAAETLSALTVAIPYLPFIGVFGFVPLPGMLLITVTAITALYVIATELTKRRFYRGVL